MTTRTPTYPGLDSLRALASIAVVGTHTSFWSGVYGNGVLGAATQRLEVGVAIFFVLSGFLLSHPFISSKVTGERHETTRRYLWKRALRILPVYWLAVVVALLAIPENRDLPPRRWIDSLLLIDLFRSDDLPFGLTQMWSLTTEVWFYLLLPIIMAAIALLAGRRTWAPARILAVLGVLVVAQLVWNSVSAEQPDQFGPWAQRGLPTYIGWFAIGIAMAVVDVDRRRPTPSLSRLVRFVGRVAANPGSCWMVAVAAFIMVSTPLAGPAGLVVLTSDESVWRHGLYAVVAAMIVLPSVFGDPDTRYARRLAHPLPRHLGHISYSLFCCHVIVLELIGERFGFTLFASDPWALFATVLAISLVVSEVLYRVVERPFLRLKNVRRSAPSASNAPSANVTNS